MEEEGGVSEEIGRRRRENKLRNLCREVVWNESVYRHRLVLKHLTDDLRECLPPICSRQFLFRDGAREELLGISHNRHHLRLGNMDRGLAGELN